MTPDDQPQIEQHAETYLAISAPNGTTRRLLQKRETVLLNPATGERRFLTDELVYTSTEGKIVDLKTYTSCARCHAQPLSSPWQCPDCKRFLCARCTHHQRCWPCHLKQQLRELLRWITSR